MSQPARSIVTGLPYLLTVCLMALLWWSRSTSFVDIGSANDQHAIKGFYDREQINTHTYRWTNGSALVQLPAVPGQAAAVFMLSGRPNDSSATLWINNTQRITVELQPNVIRRYVVLLPYSAFPSEYFSFWLHSSTERIANDGRSLGVLVESIGIRTLSGINAPPIAPLVLLLALGAGCFSLARGLGLRLTHTTCIISILNGLLIFLWSNGTLTITDHLIPLTLGVTIIAPFVWILYQPPLNNTIAVHKKNREHAGTAKVISSNNTRKNKHSQDDSPLISQYGEYLRYQDTTILIFGILFAITLRISLIDFKSGDYVFWTNIWCNSIRDNGFNVFKSNFTNYSPLYPYMLYILITLFPSLPNVVIIKIPPLIFDVIAAWYAYRIVSLRYKQHFITYSAFICVLLAPTIVLNSAAWGQADSMYTAMLLAGVYFLLVNRIYRAGFAFSVAFAFKLQAVFIIPVVLIVVLRKKHFWPTIALLPVAYILSAIPAWIAGRPLIDILLTYTKQADTYQSLSMNAPNMYIWLPNQLYHQLYLPGLIWAAAVCFLFVALVYRSKLPLTTPNIIQLALISTLLIPYILPKMHDRYFYPADIFSIIFSYYYPKKFPISVLIIMVSLFSYMPFLFNTEVVSLSILAIIQLSTIIILISILVKNIFQNNTIFNIL